MGFSVVDEPIRTFWCATDASSTYYVGQLVSYSNASGSVGSANGTVKPLIAAAGAFDTTNKQIIAGIVVGIDARTPKYATVGSHSLQWEAGVATSALQLARDWTGAEGMYIKGDPQVLVQVALIGPETVVKGNICNAALGTAPTELTATVSTDADGMVSANVTTGACDFTNVTLMGSIYCRSGKNAGLYRVSADTSTTAPQVTTAFPYNTVVGDKFVRVPLKQGISTAKIASGLYIDCSANPVEAGTNLFHLNVLRLDLAVSGAEVAYFQFGSDHFCRNRA